MKVRIVWQMEDEIHYPIILYQTGKDRFGVVYGKQEKFGLPYAAAAKELGEVIFHALVCNGAVHEYD